MPLPIYTPCKRGSDGSPKDSLELVSQYFKQSYQNLEILAFLKLHGMNISLLTLKTYLFRIIKKKFRFLMMNREVPSRRNIVESVVLWYAARCGHGSLLL